MTKNCHLEIQPKIMIFIRLFIKFRKRTFHKCFKHERACSDRMPDFFVSYNKADREWAEWIAWQLEDAGYSTKIQAWDIRPGSDFIDEMNKAIIETERTIAVLSPDSLVSRYAKMEWDATIKKGPNKLLLACISKCRPEGVYGPIIGFDLALDEETAKEPCLMQWQSWAYQASISAFSKLALHAAGNPAPALSRSSSVSLECAANA